MGGGVTGPRYTVGRLDISRGRNGYTTLPEPRQICAEVATIRLVSYSASSLNSAVRTLDNTLPQFLYV